MSTYPLIEAKGGGGGAPATPVVTAPTTAPSASSVDVQMAKTDAFRQAKRRRGLQQTVLAGDTGGYRNPTGTLLGGPK